MTVEVVVAALVPSKARVVVEDRHPESRLWLNAGNYEVSPGAKVQFNLHENKRITVIEVLPPHSQVINPTKPDNSSVITINEHAFGFANIGY